MKISKIHPNEKFPGTVFPRLLLKNLINEVNIDLINPQVCINALVIMPTIFFFILAYFNNIRSSVKTLVNIFIIRLYFRTIFICKHVENFCAILSIPFFQ